MVTSSPDPSPAPALPSPVPWGPRAAAALFLLALAWGVLSPWRTRDVPAEPGALDAVAARVRTAHGRAVVLVHPTWRQDVVQGLASRVPAAEVVVALPPDALEGRRPVLAVLWPTAPEPGALSAWPLDGEELVDGVRLRFYRGAGKAEAAPASPPVAPAAPMTPTSLDLGTRLHTAQVVVEGAARRVECNAWDAAEGRWLCPGMEEWNFVGPRGLSVGGQVRRCLWAHPVTDATLRLIFPDVPLGKQLRFGHGLRDGAAGAAGAAEVRVRLQAGAAAQDVVQANAPGWTEDVLTTTPGAGPVSLAITTPHDGARHFCISLTVEP